MSCFLLIVYQIHFVFTSRITITNDSKAVVQLRDRHWVIKDGVGHTEEVK